MAKQKCHICGGKIQNNKCIDCGMRAPNVGKNYEEKDGAWIAKDAGSEAVNNAKESAGGWKPDYKSNSKQSQRKGKASQQMPGNLQLPKNFPLPQVGKATTKEKPRGKSYLSLVIAVIIIMSSVVPYVRGYIERKMAEEQFEEMFLDYQYEKPKAVVADVEMPTEGEVYQVTLIPGEYIVGETIPQGIYDIQSVIGRGWFLWHDEEDNLIESDFLGKESGDPNKYYMETTDLYFYPGQLVTVEEDLEIVIRSENAQITDTADPLPSEIE